MAAARRLDQYLDQAYAISLTRAEDGEWVAQVDELPGCDARGGSPEEAAARVQDAMGEWIAAALAEGRSVPTPRADLSGRLLVRMPRSLHAELARTAAREQVSLNQFITGALSAAVAWRGGGGDGAAPAPGAPADAAPADPAPAEAAPPPAAPSPSWLQYALVANAVLVAVAAIVAIVLLATS